MAEATVRGVEVGLLDLLLVRADDVEGTAAFYRDVLGAVVHSVSPHWAQVRLANVDIGIHAPGGADGAGWVPGFRVHDIAAFRSHLEALGVEITQHYHDVPGGVKLGFRDAAGNVLAVYQYGVTVRDLR